MHQALGAPESLLTRVDNRGMSQNIRRTDCPNSNRAKLQASWCLLDWASCLLQKLLLQ